MSRINLLKTVWNFFNEDTLPKDLSTTADSWSWSVLCRLQIWSHERVTSCELITFFDIYILLVVNFNFPELHFSFSLISFIDSGTWTCWYVWVTEIWISMWEWASVSDVAAPGESRSRLSDLLALLWARQGRLLDTLQRTLIWIRQLRCGSSLLQERAN